MDKLLSQKGYLRLDSQCCISRNFTKMVLEAPKFVMRMFWHNVQGGEKKKNKVIVSFLVGSCNVN